MSGMLEYAAVGLFVVLGVALLLSLLRLVRGPTIADRVVSVDLITTIGVALCATYAWTTDKTVFLDVAIVTALIAFVGTVAFARYLEEKSRR
jgi:multicomponent Na+:H+ antiporter subunit F